MLLSLSEACAKIIDVRDTSKIQILEGHTKAIRALTWSPSGQYVVRNKLCARASVKLTKSPLPARLLPARTALFAFGMSQIQLNRNQPVSSYSME